MPLVSPASAGPILEEIRAWLGRPPPQLLPRSALGKAVGYLNAQWKRLVRYAQDGRLEIDNNFIENAVRPVALGRKNYLFLGSENGGRWGGVMYTLLVSARLQGLEPFAYLNDVLSRIGTHPYKQLEELLSQNGKPAAKSKKIYLLKSIKRKILQFLSSTSISIRQSVVGRMLTE